MAGQNNYDLGMGYEWDLKSGLGFGGGGSPGVQKSGLGLMVGFFGVDFKYNVNINGEEFFDAKAFAFGFGLDISYNISNNNTDTFQLGLMAGVGARFLSIQGNAGAKLGFWLDTFNSNRSFWGTISSDAGLNVAVLPISLNGSFKAGSDFLGKPDPKSIPVWDGDLTRSWLMQEGFLTKSQRIGGSYSNDLSVSERDGDYGFSVPTTQWVGRNLNAESFVTGTGFESRGAGGGYRDSSILDATLRPGSSDVYGDLPDIAQQYPDMFGSGLGSDASSGSSFSSRGAGGGGRDSNIVDSDGRTGGSYGDPAPRQTGFTVLPGSGWMSW